MHTRREFIRNTGMGAVSLGLLPGLPLLAAENNPFATSGLPRATPESQGVSSEGIRRFVQAANATGFSWHSFMLLRHGHVIAEGWWKPFEPSFVHTLYSLSKSFTSSAVGLAVKENGLDIHRPLISFFPEDKPGVVSDNLQQMTLRHLLTMNTGHGEDTMPKMQRSAQPWTKTFLEQPVIYNPGSHFLYNTGATYMLGAVIHKATGQTLEQYLTPRLFAPLGITGYDWEISPQGLNTAGYGLRLKTEDIARFGQMYLQNGRWNDKEILSSSWVQEATSKQTASQEGDGDWSQGYGYQFWRCKPGFYRGDGAHGQYCIVMQDLDAVMVVTEQTPNMQESMKVIWENIPAAMQQSPLPENKEAFRSLRKELAGLMLVIPKGSIRSALSGNYHQKNWSLEKNELGAERTQFRFFKDGCEWITSTGEKETRIRFGWEHWVTSQESGLYPFPEGNQVKAPSRLAGTATWINDQTLQLNIRFVQGMLGDRITCNFSGDTLSISFLNSIAEASKNQAGEGRKPLIGKMV
jgi:CubicO group peptidase (beta-lactamase class C family)